MTKVLIHGNPETDAIWHRLVTALGKRGIDDVVTLSPPGFGSPVPAGWSATQTAYRDWLIAELEAIAKPIDLVAHDWGAAHVFGVIAHRPELVQSWAADCVGLIAPDYVWHDMAQAWQTPAVGEQVIAAMVDTALVDRTKMLVDLGIPAATAADIAPAMDATMGECVLRLYRSAVQPAMSQLGSRLLDHDLPPGRAIIALDDPYIGSIDNSVVTAHRLGADTITLDGLGHWWMFEGADRVADALVEFWHT